MSSADEIVAVATLKAIKGSEEALGDALRTAASSSRNDDGCITYEVHVDIADPSVFAIYERWASEQALRAHIKSESSQAMFARLKNITDAAGANVTRFRPLS